MANPQCTTQDQPERWLPVVGYEGYYSVSDQGRVRVDGNRGYPHGRPGKYLSLNNRNDKGYLAVCLSHNGHKKMRMVAHLVAEAFIGPRPRKMVVNHINGIRTDNRAANLEYLSTKDNVRHAVRLGLKKHGEGHPRAKLTEADVREIKRLIEQDELTANKIGAAFGVTGATVAHIRDGKTWANVS